MTSESEFDPNKFSEEQLKALNELGEQMGAFMSAEREDSNQEPPREPFEIDLSSVFSAGFQQPPTQPSEPEFPELLKRVAQKLIAFCIERIKTEHTLASNTLGIPCDWPEPLKPFIQEPLPIPEDKLTEENLFNWANSDNVFMRLELARRGLAADILKYDSISLVRFHILKTTGKYNERFQSEETSLQVIGEMIRQNIERDFWCDFNVETAQMVVEQQKFENMVSQIEQGDKDSYQMAQGILLGFSEQPDSSRFPVNEVMQILNLLYENALMK